MYKYVPDEWLGITVYAIASAAQAALRRDGHRSAAGMSAQLSFNFSPGIHRCMLCNIENEVLKFRQFFAKQMLNTLIAIFWRAAFSPTTAIRLKALKAFRH